MIPITPETVRAVYTMLLEFPPFSKWNLPAANKVTFVVAPLKSMWGDLDPNTHTMRVSTVKVTTFLSLVTVVAHEMVHLKQDVSGRWPAKDAHNAHFTKLATRVCKHFPFFDPANF
jgi:predicted metal-dependent hydrolase